MPLTIRPVTNNDAPKLAHIMCEAFNSNTIHTAMFPTENKPALETFFTEKELHNINSPKHTVLALCDDTLDDGGGEIVAYITWVTPLKHLVLDSNQTGENVQQQHVSGGLAPPPGTNQALSDQMRDSRNEMKARYYRAKEDYLLSLIATHPDHRNRGCGSLLLKACIEAAEKVNARIYLHASEEAYSLYRKHGWNEVDRFVLNVGDDLDATMFAMIRDSASTTSV
ncbi:hypothetical protein ASPWEDRAFT_38161 [Aspergillus wentii DTO 134E9]|uniref:N-acetyltransferase domain-containing protein n=1 Tax=Aspergillus wentii DTO 134E9 TaxID=1073089 RepID=A0A1L9RNZ3_ASPWE|nr:uncharacterized protein ASPWEDRAFT_38161 [Aspergillus wentii DTO 134E9]KAI9934305.1 hypothetical protein MW887_005379 [Aspergillus wentii]OJJ36557.1 hypothetical protein ASPWEDRAFT_38161 [Aspergillus wentii DTO 134E9]